MNKRTKRGSSMVVSTIIMGIIAAALLFAGYYKGQGQHVTGVKTAMHMILEVMPLLIFAFIVAGMARSLFPPETISGYIGKESGLRGIFIGTVVGGLAPGGPYVSMPIAAGQVSGQ